MNELEDVLIEMTQQVMNLEDSGLQYESILEAKKVFLLGIIRQVDIELQILNKEYDVLGISLADEFEEIEVFETAMEAYNGVMSSLFKH